MTHTPWDRVAELFDAVVDLPAEEREARIAAAGDATLGREVRDLIRASRSSGNGGFIAETIAATAADLTAGASRVGQRVGPYRLIRELGHGGMGAVYLAEREDAAYRATVAIKFILGGRAGPDAVRRFRSERQILAGLVHPSIARLLDGGTADDGTPYLVMEHVDGEAIDAYCARGALPVRDRVRLFRTVCEAVQAAHAALVVHRDLKPANILVTPDGRSKLLDFGIAKLLEDDAGEARDVTTAMRLTPSYASPEQIRGERVTVATDVYSLGVVLYELLTGRLPVDPGAVSSRAELERRICEEQPPAPSAVATDAALRGELAGDLDTIVGKALRKEPAERYQSAADLADDLRRFLDAEPVRARPPTMRYRLEKFVRRHRAGVAGAAVAFLLLAGTVTYYTTRLAAERDVAREEAAKAEQVAGFLAGLFEAADPAEARGQEITARELLERGAERVERELAAWPSVRATMLGVIGRTYRSLGLYNEAEPFLNRAVTLQRDSLPASPAALAEALADLGRLARNRGELEQADSLLTAAVMLRRDGAGDAPARALVSTLASLGMTAMDRGDLPRADTVLSEAVALARALPETGPDVLATADALTDLGRVRSRQGEHASAAALLREALERERRALGDDHPDVGETLDALAETLRLEGKLEEAETTFREAVAHGRRVLGDSHTTVASRLGNLANTLDNLGRHTEALAIHQDVLARNRAVLGPNHFRVARTLNNLASSYSAMGRYDDAERTYLEAIALHRRNHGDEHPSIATVLNNLAHVRAEKRDVDGAVAYQRRALVMDRKLLGDTHPYVGQDLVLIGVFLLAADRVAEAEQPLREGTTIVREALGDDHPANAVGLYALGKYLAAAEQWAEAEAVTQEVLRIRRAARPAGHWETAMTETLLGEIYAATGRDAEAESLLVHGYEIVRLDQPEGSRNRTEVRERVVEFFLARGRPERAAAVPP